MFPSKTVSVSPSPPSTKTLTVVTDPCDGIYLGGISFSDTRFSLIITNSRPDPIIISHMFFHWPPEHERLNRVMLGSKVIWDFGDWDPPTEMPPWRGSPTDREIKAFDSKKLEFQFEEEAEEVFVNDYFLEITFEVMPTGQLCTMPFP
jgi:hypothetical protein